MSRDVGTLMCGGCLVVCVGVSGCVCVVVLCGCVWVCFCVGVFFFFCEGEGGSRGVWECLGVGDVYTSLLLRVVSPFCPVYCNACLFLCLLSLLLLVPSFVNLGMALGFIAFCFCLQMLLLETRLSISFQNVGVGGLNLCIWCCWCQRQRVCSR